MCEIINLENSENNESLMKKIEIDFGISLDTLSKATGISISSIEEYKMSGKMSKLSVADKMHFEGYVVLLALSMPADEDLSVCAVIQALQDTYSISLQTIATYAQLDIERVQSFMKDCSLLEYKERYELAVATLFLYFILNKRKDV